jgi:hypothetical protein
MALTTTFKKSVPYNTIRLVGDVAQWAQTEQTHLDNSTLPPIPSVSDVSMAHMQKASGANIDPGDGTISTVGTLGDMRYGVAILSDVSTGDGVYTYQVGNTNANFVQTRKYDLASNPIDISLGRMTQWDYTANLEYPDIDKFDITTSTSADWRASSQGSELFKDQPMWAWGVRDSVNTSSRKVYIIRSHPNGGRYSSYAVTNRLIVNHVSDMNDIQQVVPVRSEYGTTLGSNIRSFLTLGRRTSSTGNLKAGLYSLNLGTGGTWSATSTTTGNISTQFGNNSATFGSAYLRDDLVCAVASRGGAGRSLVRISTAGGSISSTYTNLTTAASYGANGDVVTIPDETGSTPLAFPIWTELRSTYNRYVKMQAYNLNSGFSSASNVLTVFDVSNSIKAAGGAVLKAGSNTALDPHIFLVWASDTSGNVRLQTVAMGQGTLSITGMTSTTISIGDTAIESFVVISPLSAVERTDISISGESFVPGGTNDFKKRRYFTISVGTNQSQGTNRLYYGYYDIDNNALVTWDGGSFTGREIKMARSHYDTDSRQYARDLYLRGESGAVWMPFLAGRYIGSSDRRLTFGMTSLDYKPNWSGLNGADPGSTFYDQGNLVGTGAYFDTRTSEADWGNTGRWYVLGPHPLYPGNTDALIRFADSYATNTTFSDGVGSGLEYFVMEDEDIDGVSWADFVETQVAGFNVNNNVYVRVQTGALNAYYMLAPSGGKGVYVTPSNHIVIPWIGKNNNHSGNQWGFLWNTTTGETKNAVSITFKQSPF